MLPTFLKSILWGSEEEQVIPETEEKQFVAEQREDWVLISEQGEAYYGYDLLTLP